MNLKKKSSQIASPLNKENKNPSLLIFEPLLPFFSPHLQNDTKGQSPFCPQEVRLFFTALVLMYHLVQ